MNYCSIEDAFQMAPGCKNDYASKEARKEERRKAKRCKGPALTFMDAQGGSKDPDRQHIERPDDVPVLNRRTGLREHTPVDAPYGDSTIPVPGAMEAFQNSEDSGIDDELARQRISELLPRTDDDPVGDAQRSTLPTPAMLAQAMSSGNQGQAKKKGFFGADPTEDNFADYLPDARNYLMEPNFTNAFQGLLKNNAPSPALDIPSVRDVWKPLIPSGAETAFFGRLPAPGGQYPNGDAGLSTSQRKHDESYQSMARKIDRILARLDDIQKGPNPEQSQSEVLMFVSSGIFVLFLMDLLVRKGSSMRFLGGL